MKIVSIILVLLSLTTYVEAQIYKFRAFQSTMVPTDEDLKQTNPVKWDSTNILVVINLDKHKVHIYAEKETDIDIIRIIKSESDKDDKSAIWTIEQGVDQDGENCKVITKLMPSADSEYKAALFIEYKIATYIFKLRKNE